jgi:hypothetical protein
VGFTRMAESMEPEDVVTLLREFHERMAREKRVIIRIKLDRVGPTVRG